MRERLNKSPERLNRTGETWITARQAAPILGVELNTVYKWINSGRLPSSRPFGRLVRLRESAVVQHAQDMREYTLDAQGAARHMGCTTHTIYRAVKHQGLPSKNLGGLMFRPEDLDKYFADREVNAE